MDGNGARRTVIHTSFVPEQTQVRGKSGKKAAGRPGVRRVRPRGKAGFGERLLRNTAVACALLLGILTLKNLDAPWSKAAVKGLEAALTMRIDPDDSLGRLDFVRNIMPETSLVFFNISASAPASPVDGEIDHGFTQSQPWVTYACGEAAEVRSVMAGTVSAVTRLQGDDWCVLVDHGGGIETMYAFMDEPEVQSGDAVARGARLGEVMGDTLYYEMRRDGSSVAPDGGED